MSRTKFNRLKMIFKILKIKLKKFTSNSKTLIIPNFSNKQLNLNNKFMLFGMSLRNLKINTLPKLKITNTNKKKSSISNGPNKLKRKKPKSGNLKNRKEKDKDLKKKNTLRKTKTKKLLNKVRRNKDKL